MSNETAGTVRVARPLRVTDYSLSGGDPFIDGGDTFVACASGNFDAFRGALILVIPGLTTFIPNLISSRLDQRPATDQSESWITY